jgi:hypothetical protein
VTEWVAALAAPATLVGHFPLRTPHCKGVVVVKFWTLPSPTLKEVACSCKEGEYHDIVCNRRPQCKWPEAGDSAPRTLQVKAHVLHCCVREVRRLRGLLSPESRGGTFYKCVTLHINSCRFHIHAIRSVNYSLGFRNR